MAFWRRKSSDRYITLGLNEPAAPQTPTPAPPALEPPAATAEQPQAAPDEPALAPATTGSAPTPAPQDETAPPPRPPAPARPVEPPKPAPPQPVPSRSPFTTSILGLDRSMEELQAEEAALERTFEKRFRNAVAATRVSLSETIDNVFQGRKEIDADLLDQLEEALIAADIGVPTTLSILDTVRRGIDRKQINDIAALKAAIKHELLTILHASTRAGVATEASVPEDINPYVMMIVGVNGVGKTTTIGKLAQRIKAEGNDVLICAADTFRAAATDQLAIWAERTGVPLIQQKSGTDPAAVLFDALKAAKARNSDVLIVDTAGR